MMTQYEVPQYLSGKLPQIRQELAQHGAEANIYHSIQVLADYTKRMAIGHNFRMVEKCMHLVSKIYENGNALVKNAVENIFVFSFSSIMAVCNIVEWRIVQSYMPAGLYYLYVQQVLKSRD